VQFAISIFHYEMKPKNVTLAFVHLVSEAGFGELTFFNFQFKESPSCDLLLTFCVMR
jgi:hypothetical protein